MLQLVPFVAVERKEVEVRSCASGKATVSTAALGLATTKISKITKNMKALRMRRRHPARAGEHLLGEPVEEGTRSTAEG